MDLAEIFWVCSLGYLVVHYLLSFYITASKCVFFVVEKKGNKMGIGVGEGGILGIWGSEPKLC